MVDNVVGFPVYGDYGEPNPPARIIDAVARGDIDVAAVWGPLAGYFAKRAAVPLTVVPIADTAEFRPLEFAYDISMGVRHGDRALHRRLDAVINRKGPEITALLKDFGVPLVDPPYLVHEAAQQSGPPAQQ
jgi:ABC-type amino acid transport substrate-binding protein